MSFNGLTLEKAQMDSEQKSVEMDGAKLEDQLREAVRRVMSAVTPAAQDLAAVQELVDRRAALIRAPMSEKIRRVKSAA